MGLRFTFLGSSYISGVCILNDWSLSPPRSCQLPSLLDSQYECYPSTRIVLKTVHTMLFGKGR